MPWMIALALAFFAMWWWTALMFAIGTACYSLAALLRGQLIRATIWGCISAAGWLWLSQDEWIPHPYQVDKWLHNSINVVGFVIVCIVLYHLNQAFHAWRRGEQVIPSFLLPYQPPVIPPFGQLPEITGNVVPFVHATRQEKERVMQVQGHLCANPYCNADLRDGVPHWDHIKPRNKGGTDSVHNGQWLCDTCNLNKNDADWLEFLFKYATSMGQDPNKNQKPWQKWVMTRVSNGLQCQG